MNRCDVSGETTRCQKESDCVERVPIGSDNNHCVYCSVDWACTKVKAIRAAIEAEHIADASKMVKQAE